MSTAGSEHKAKIAKQLGADTVIRYKEVDDLAQEFKTACPDGFEVVMDGVGGTLQEAFLGNLVPGAKVLLTGYISEYPHNEGASHSASFSAQITAAADCNPYG